MTETSYQDRKKLLYLPYYCCSDKYNINIGGPVEAQMNTKSISDVSQEDINEKIHHPI
jgi:hypothetical protein